MKVFKLVQDILDDQAGKIVPVVNGIGEIGPQWASWEIPEFIMAKNPAWFKDVSIDYMDITEKTELIKKNLLRLKQAHNWCEANYPAELGLDGSFTTENEQLFKTKFVPELDKIMAELAEVGVEKDFSVMVFIMGGIITQKLVDEVVKASNIK